MILADKLIEPRTLKVGDKVIFFSNRVKGNVFGLKDFNNDLRPDSIYTIVTHRTAPNGIALRNGDLYLAETSQISVVKDVSAKLGKTIELTTIFTSMPSDYMHGWRYIDFGPDDKLYVAVGASCDSCEEPEEYANIFYINPDGTGRERVASGVRNSVGFDWHPKTAEMWFSENGCDMLGDAIPPDEINRISDKDSHFGFPYKYGTSTYDDTHETPDSSFKDPEYELPAHTAPLGIHFYTGKMFPEKYRNQLFICEHGSRVLENKRGYKISLLELDSNSNVSKYSVFASGWLNEKNQKVLGRPVDIDELPDGSLIVSDDYANIIYRISYSGD